MIINSELSKLINIWDPVGLIACGAPEDEYDCLTQKLLSQLYRSSEIEKLCNFLEQELSYHFGYTPPQDYKEKFQVELQKFATFAAAWFDSMRVIAEDKQIEKDEVIPLVVAYISSFKQKWNEHLNDIWDRESDNVLYTDLSVLAKHTIGLVKENAFDELKRLFELIEILIHKGDKYVVEAVSIGLLEDIQNCAFSNNIELSSFDKYMKPNTKEVWDAVNCFWNKEK